MWSQQMNWESGGYQQQEPQTDIHEYLSINNSAAADKFLLEKQPQQAHLSYVYAQHGVGYPQGTASYAATPLHCENSANIPPVEESQRIKVLLRFVEAAKQNRMKAEQSFIQTREALQSKHAEVRMLEAEAAKLVVDRQMLNYQKWKMQKFHEGLDLKVAKMEKIAEESQMKVEVERQQSWKWMEVQHMNAMASCNETKALKFGRSGWKRKKAWSAKKRKRSHQLGRAENFEEGDVSLESYGRKWKKTAIEFDSDMLSSVKNRRGNVPLLGPGKIKVFEPRCPSVFAFPRLGFFQEC
jgi:hypothetical protein